MFFFSNILKIIDILKCQKFTIGTTNGRSDFLIKNVIACLMAKSRTCWLWHMEKSLKSLILFSV